MKLKELREKISISQKELANKLGIEYSKYNKYENGVYEPSIETLIKIADFFNVSVDTLLGHKCEMIDRRNLSSEQNEIIDLVLNFNKNEQTNALGYLRRLSEEKDNKKN